MPFKVSFLVGWIPSNDGSCDKGWLKALENGNGKKLGLYKKLGKQFGQGEAIDTMFETGKIEHILAAIDNIVNGEVNLPPGGHDALFRRIREVGKGYTVIGTKYTYNTRNQLTHREDLIRYEDYNYTYDDAGSLLSDERSLFEWNPRGQLTKVTFPDGFGEKYTYDMLGRRVSKTQFNHRGETQDVTNYIYKGDTWVITEETNEIGEVTKSYSFDANERPLTITFKGQTFWYVYNGHGDVVAMTDAEGKVAARYEYDAWGLVTWMYNQYGERVREGTGWIGDLGSGNGSPGSLQGPEDSSGNTDPDYHPGNGNDKSNNGNGNGNGNAKKTSAFLSNKIGSLSMDFISLAAKTNNGVSGNDKGKGNSADTKVQATEEATAEDPSTVTDSVYAPDALAAMVTTELEPTEDITTDLVKENPFRYAGYYFDRKTQYYYLQARYYDPRPARFISEDSYEGERNDPLRLNLYVYVSNNPLRYIDISGNRQCEGAYSCDVATGVANKSNWVKVGDGAYKIVDWYMMGAISDYVDTAQKKPYSVEHFTQAGLLVISVVPIAQAEAATLKVSNVAVKEGTTLIKKVGKWFSVKVGKKVQGKAVNKGVGNGVNGVGNLVSRGTTVNVTVSNLQQWSKSKGWIRQDTAGGVQQWGVKGADGTFSWRLKIKLEESTRSGLQSGIQQLRIDSRLDLGNYYNPFTGQTGGKDIGTHIPLEQ